MNNYFQLFYYYFKFYFICSVFNFELFKIIRKIIYKFKLFISLLFIILLFIKIIIIKLTNQKKKIYDLKGSVSGRKATEEEKREGRGEGRGEGGGEGRGGGGGGGGGICVLKDLDFVVPFLFGDERKTILLSQLKLDCDVYFFPLSLYFIFILFSFN